MKKILFILALVLLSFDVSFAITVETPVALPLDWCSWTVCNISPGQAWFDQIFQSIVKYITFIASLLWVLFIVVNGIAYAMSWVDESLKSKSKSRIIKMLIWLILLLLSAMILHILAPWVF